MPVSIHEHPEEWLAASLADGLSPDERRLLDEHLAGCGPCRSLRADLASLDEVLLRDFPAAVGPAAGFETRLVAGFRRGQERRNGVVSRLRATVGWLLRQRGARVAGVAAVLLALVGIGARLTGIPATTGPQPTTNEARLKPSADATQETNLHSEGSLGLERRYGFNEAPDVADVRTRFVDFPRKAVDSPVPSSGGESGQRGSYTGAVQLGLGTSPVVTGTNFASQKAPFSLNGPTLSLTGANTYTGATQVSAGTLIVGGGVRTTTSASVGGTVEAAHPPNLTLLNGTRLAENKPSPTTPSSLASDNEPTTPTPAKPAVPVPDLVASAPVTDTRKLVRNASADLEVGSFDVAVDAVSGLAASNGGFLSTRESTRSDNGKVSGTLICKLLPDHLDRFLAALRPLGDLENQSIQTEDITKDYFDTDARLRNARRMEDRLLKMLAEVKGKMSEVLQVEKEIGRVRADIEEMQGQLKLYDAQVRYATVTLDVHEKDLGQPVAFLLNETATLALLVADVEKSAVEARRIADAAHAQVLGSDVSRDSSGRTRATLHVLIAPEKAAEVIAQVKELGRVETYHVEDQRTAKNGDSSETASTDPAKVERAPVTFDVTISHDEQISRQISFTLVAPDVEATFEKARAAALAAGGEIVNANVSHVQTGHATATLGLRVPPTAENGLIAALKAFGRVGEVETRRTDSGAENSSGPVFISLNVADVEPPVQRTSVQVQTGDVERCVEQIKREAAASHIDLEASSFASEGNHRQHAGLRFRLPISGYPGFIERVRALGTVKEYAVRREDRPETTKGDGDASAPAVIELTLYDEGSIVGTESGLGATLRRTFGQGTNALTWSIQMIGVAVAFLAPWVAVLAVAVWAIRRYRRRVVRPLDEKAS